jgi:DNA-binding transcriptional LysR family regulator
MEQFTGQRLFDRSPAKGIAVTRAGEEVERQVVRFLEQARNLEMALTSLKSRLTGTLSVACYAPVARYVIPPFLHRFRLRYPEIEIFVEEHDMDRIDTLIADRTIDVAMTFMRSPADGASFMRLFLGRPYILMQANSELAHKPVVMLQDLCALPMIALGMPIYEDYIRSLFGTAGLSPNIAHRTKSPSVLRAMVGAGYGYSILNTYSPDDRSGESGCVAKPLGNEVDAPAFGMVFVENQPTSSLVHTARTIGAELVVDCTFDHFCLSPAL